LCTKIPPTVETPTQKRKARHFSLATPGTERYTPSTTPPRKTSDGEMIRGCAAPLVRARCAGGFWGSWPRSATSPSGCPSQTPRFA
jgi:hypothetical protein